jgi:hypothetical protein
MVMLLLLVQALCTWVDSVLIIAVAVVVVVYHSRNVYIWLQKMIYSTVDYATCATPCTRCVCFRSRALHVVVR